RHRVEHDEKYLTFTRLDTEGKPLYIRDARKNLVMQYIFPALADDREDDPVTGFVPCYDIAGNLLVPHSMDGGDRFMLADAAGQPLFTWDVNHRVEDSGERVLEHRVLSTTYDALRRPTEQRLHIDGADHGHLVSLLVYGESLSSPHDARASNLRGQVFEQFDPSGL